MLYNREFYENNIGNDLSCSSQEDTDQIVQNNPKLIVQILQDENILEDIITPQNKERKYRKTSNRRAAPRNRNESYAIEEMDLLNDSQMSFPGSTNDSVAWQLTHVYTAIVQKKLLPEQYYFICDEAVSSTETVLSPFSGRGIGK